MVDKKHQHWVPASYLAAWADPNRPAHYDPYVHIFARDGGAHTKRAPQNIFHMPELYTIFSEGGRDLSIESAFGQWEGSFVRVRNRIEAGQDISEEDVAILYVFTGAMLVRPPHRITFIANQWAHVVEQARSIRIDPNVPPIPSLSKGPSMSLDEAQQLADDPMGTWFRDNLANNIEVLASRFGCDVLVNRSEHPFLTSDDPAVIQHPPRDARFRNMPRGLGSPGCEITLPISPRTALLFRHKTPSPAIHDYLTADWETVFETNYSTITRARHKIISDREDLFFVKTITDMVAEVERGKTP
jgi:Protein of unknown function (DUF4238)